MPIAFRPRTSWTWLPRISRPVPEPTDAEFPFILLTGRGTSAQWHTNTRTAKSAILRRLYPAECYVEIHPDDAARLGIHRDSKVRIRSRRAGLEANAFITTPARPGQVFLPFHYAEFNSNQVTQSAFDPISREPNYKQCAVRVERSSNPRI